MGVHLANERASYTIDKCQTQLMPWSCAEALSRQSRPNFGNLSTHQSDTVTDLAIHMYFMDRFQDGCCHTEANTAGSIYVTCH